MEKDHVLRKIELHFDELELLTDYLKDQSEESLEIVEELAGTLAKIKRRCSTLPLWALKTFDQVLENYALRAMLMAGNAILLQERRTVIETMRKEVGRIEKKQKEYYKQKEKVISILNTLKAFNIPSDFLESELRSLALSEKEIERKKHGSFSQIEKEIESLLTKSSELIAQAEEKKKELVTEKEVRTIPEVQQYLDMVRQLETYGVRADAEKECIETHTKALIESNCHQWSQIFYALQKDTEALKKKVTLAEELQASLSELEHVGMDGSLSEAWTLYETGGLLKAERIIKDLKKEYEEIKEKGGRRKIAETLFVQCEKMLADLPAVSEEFTARYKRVQDALETDDVVSEDFLDEIQTFKMEIEDFVARFMEKELREETLKKTASELREKITKVNKDIRDILKTFDDLGCKKDNTEKFQNEIKSMRKEITAVLAESGKAQELSEEHLKSLSNRLSHIDVRIEDTKMRIASYVRAYDSFVRYRESYMELFLILPEVSKEELEKELYEVKEFLREHLFEIDFPVEALVEKVKNAEIDLKEREIALRDSIRKIEKMKNELLAMKGDFAFMGYSWEEEHFEKKIQKIFEEKDIITNEEIVEEIEKQKKELKNLMKDHFYENIGNEINILEKIKKEGNIEKYELFIKDIIEITQKYDFPDLKARAEDLIEKRSITVRKCPHLDCETDIEGNVQFCPSCGRNIVLCPVCDKYNKAQSKFCTACGRLLKIQEHLMETLGKGNPVGFQDLMDLHLEEEEAKQVIQTFFDNCSPVSEELFGNPLDMEDFCIFVIKTTVEEIIRELLPLHGALSADDIDDCTPEDIVRFYEKYKDSAIDELGYEIELIEDMVVKK